MNTNTWRKKTTAPLLTISQLRELVQEKSNIVIGLAGFSGNFDKSQSGDLEFAVQRVIEVMLKRKIKDFVPRSIFLVSGATNVGVPHIGYLAAMNLGCISIGVTAGVAQQYEIAPLDYLTIIGENFGDESNGFISILDELWVIGGGTQSQHECNLAVELEIPLTIFQGIGGIADSLPTDTKNAIFIDIHEIV